MVTNTRNSLRGITSFKATVRKAETVRVKGKKGEVLRTASVRRKSLVGSAKGRIVFKDDLTRPTLQKGSVFMKRTNLEPAGQATEPRAPADLRGALVAAPPANVRWRGLTPIERRDFIGWMDSAKKPEANRRRIQKACALLAAGRRRP